jgi:hypothetical protein
MASLPEIQSRFAAALRGKAGPALPATVGGAGSARTEMAGDSSAMRNEVTGDTASLLSEVIADGIDPEARLHIYRNNSRAMFEGALERTYPVLRRRVGEDYFRQLAHGYRERHPSRSGDLHWVGRDFPAYVATTLGDSEYAWLAELAQLEWACECALVAANRTSLGVEALAELNPDALGDTRLDLQDSLQCVASSFPVLDVWRANQPDAAGAAIDLARGGQCVLVSCDDQGLELCEVPPAVFEFVRVLQQGATLVEAVDGSALSPDDLPRALGVLFEAGLVTGCPGTSGEGRV